MYKWTDGEVITEEKLNETGNIVFVKEVNNALDMTVEELNEAYRQGKTFCRLNAFENGDDYGCGFAWCNTIQYMQGGFSIYFSDSSTTYRYVGRTGYPTRQ